MSSRSTSVLSSSTSDGFFLCDVARDSFQLLDLVIAVGGLKGKLPIGIRLCGGDSVFSGKLDGFCIKIGQR